MSFPEIGELKSLEVIFALLPGLVTYMVHRALVHRERAIETTKAVL